MTSLSLRRVASGMRGTFGVLLMDGDPICVTCEDPWNDNASGDSCIPPGTYRCVPHNGPRFSNVWEVTGVSGRSAILIHNGNSIADTHGCILCGDGFGNLGGLPAVLNSVATLNKLRKLLPPEFDLVVS
jgi:hypothetical protein